MRFARDLVVAVAAVAFFVVVCGAVYPLVLTGLAQLALPDRANGSLVVDHGVVVGSDLVGQQFSSARYFQGRPSATTPPYNAMASTGTNLGPTNPALVESVAPRVTQARAASEGVAVPIDLVTSSGSGLDPHISPPAARLQAERVARARGLPVGDVRALVDAHVEGSVLWLGQPRVNVLRLNRALDAM